MQNEVLTRSWIQTQREATVFDVTFVSDTRLPRSENPLKTHESDSCVFLFDSWARSGSRIIISASLLYTTNQHNNHAQRPAGHTPPNPQYAVTTLAHAPPSPPTRPTRPRPRVQRQHFPRPTARATPRAPAPRPAASSLAGLYSAFRPNPLGGRNPRTVSSTAPLRQSSGTFSSTAVPSRQDLNDLRPVPRSCHGVVCFTLAMNPSTCYSCLRGRRRWIASAMCAGWIRSLPARSAIVRASLSTR